MAGVKVLRLTPLESQGKRARPNDMLEHVPRKAKMKMGKKVHISAYMFYASFASYFHLIHT